MSVTASFEPGRISSEPGGTAALTLRLHNDAPNDEVVKLRAAGALADQTVLQTETIYLDPNETFEVPVIVDVGSALPAGPHASTIEISGGQGVESVAEATIDVVESMGYTISLLPEQSRSSTAGRHKVSVSNTGNTPVLVDLTAEAADEAVEIDLATMSVNVYPGDDAKVEARVIPPSRFWNGPTVPHEFVIHATVSDGSTRDLPGTFEQGPRLRPWLLPAAVGALVALLIGTLAWFTLLKPSVEQIAEDAADTALAELIAEIEQAAEEANELPLGQPADLRLAVAVAPGSTGSESFRVSADRVLSVTDVLLQNPSGAAGRVSLLRNGDVLLESELANFRDLDFHFVAPLQFEGSSTVELLVECTTPGPNQAECDVASTIIGYVDEER